jgi:hypothetical protein
MRFAVTISREPGNTGAVTMLSSFDFRSPRNDGGPQQPIAISAAVVILAVTALACAGLVAVPLWTALVRDWQVDAISDRCGLKAQAARQDCLEELKLEESRDPAKGANAPIGVHPREQKDD